MFSCWSYYCYMLLALCVPIVQGSDKRFPSNLGACVAGRREFPPDTIGFHSFFLPMKPGNLTLVYCHQHHIQATSQGTTQLSLICHIHLQTLSPEQTL